ncbi:NRDE protein-domain-containing protein [Radiomyces spectabilis]|uniref:NRDE protein-domain-containing protein n=1 Tax=Radiomyces spectabilis TaxID=64574 RepID=UPI00221E45AA|nr:NRDE protein-domain-containing protein [Radiomyces spectabilis]KAI8374432.1 NRDE protein-domain-containing protein [Radiomyces spectabilis]
MCILFWIADHPKYRFIFAANRDEFLHRETADAAFWESPNDYVVAGRDLEPSTSSMQHGTWLGLTKHGRFAALTNYRERVFQGRLSRGILVRDFLTSNISVDDYMIKIRNEKDMYGGFNLVCFDGLNEEGDLHMAYYSNRMDTDIISLQKNVVYGLSNSVLDVPWPKVEEGRQKLESILEKCADNEDQLIESLFTLLSTTKPLPDTSNLELVLEEMKQRICIPKFSNSDFGNATEYATRTSTVILVDHDGHAVFVERQRYDEQGAVRNDTGTVFRFKLQKK